MKSWIILDFVNMRGENEILSWLNSLPRKAKAKINARLVTLAGYPEPWPPQYISAYNGWDDVYELKIVFGGRQFRPLGCYGPERRQFTILSGGEEKGKIPTRLLGVADERRKLVFDGSARTVPHDFS